MYKITYFKYKMKLFYSSLERINEMEEYINNIAQKPDFKNMELATMIPFFAGIIIVWKKRMEK